MLVTKMLLSTTSHRKFQGMLTFITTNTVVIRGRFIWRGTMERVGMKSGVAQEIRETSGFTCQSQIRLFQVSLNLDLEM